MGTHTVKQVSTNIHSHAGAWEQANIFEKRPNFWHKKRESVHKNTLPFKNINSKVYLDVVADT